MLRPVLGGLASYVPGINRLRTVPTGGTDSARYCYSVWLRHLVLAAEHGAAARPRIVAELGPGDSVGIGLCALLTGAERYLGLDVVRYASLERNQRILDELVGLLRARTPIPDAVEFPVVKPYLDDYRFPAHLLDFRQ